MNKYGHTSACIAYKRPEFREICYCSKLLNRTHVKTVKKKLIKTKDIVANSNN